jgi:hypothetical protein
MYHLITGITGYFPNFVESLEISQLQLTGVRVVSYCLEVLNSPNGSYMPE